MKVALIWRYNLYPISSHEVVSRLSREFQVPINNGNRRYLGEPNGTQTIWFECKDLNQQINFKVDGLLQINPVHMLVRAIKNDLLVTGIIVEVEVDDGDLIFYAAQKEAEVERRRGANKSSSHSQIGSIFSFLDRKLETTD